MVPSGSQRRRSVLPKVSHAYKRMILLCAATTVPIADLAAPRQDTSTMSETEKPHGIPYVPGSTPVDEWSLAIHGALRDWPVAKGAKWERWEPGYLVLTISGEADDPFDPIVLDTYDDELTVTFGYWETHLPLNVDAGASESDTAAREAKELVEDWLAGRTLTAIYFGAEDKWCGSITVDPSDLPERLLYGAAWIKDFGPTRIELRTPRKRDWRHFVVRDGEVHPAEGRP